MKLADARRSVLRPTISDRLSRYEEKNGVPPGIATPASRSALVEQLVASVRRTVYLDLLTRPKDPSVADPTSGAFNPLSAAALQAYGGDENEALWLTFLFVHFGKHRLSGWSLIADVYGRLSGETRWTWEEASGDVTAFRLWLEENRQTIYDGPPKRRFGNHRKYESLSGLSDRGTGAAIASYVEWAGNQGPALRVVDAIASGTNREHRFDLLYKSVRTVQRLGRTGAFDYCSTLARLGLVDIEPGSAYLAGATGPLAGAQLLLAKRGEMLERTELEARLAPLRSELLVGYDVIEDALCNWQKSPTKFKPFLG